MRTFIVFFINRKLARRDDADGSTYDVIGASTKAIALKRAKHEADGVFFGRHGYVCCSQVIVEELTYARAKKIFGMYKTYLNAMNASGWAADLFWQAANMLTDDDATRLSDGEFCR
ncbi:MAG: hypothetical protein IJQ01_05825 [Selenomonadaceae bacterium]|nr:hypothetical protein [Selenomonadaceae bacterium]